MRFWQFQHKKIHNFQIYQQYPIRKCENKSNIFVKRGILNIFEYYVTLKGFFFLTNYDIIMEE